MARQDDLQDENGTVYHTYSSYARGIDMLNTPYHYLDLVPKGRDEDSLESPQAWVQDHDSYKDQKPRPAKKAQKTVTKQRKNH